MADRINEYSSYILFMVCIIIFTPILTVTTREYDLAFDPVLLCLGFILLFFTASQFDQKKLAWLFSIPVLFLSLLPIVGLSEIQNNPNNPNLLIVQYYYAVASYLLFIFFYLKKAINKSK